MRTALRAAAIFVAGAAVATVIAIGTGVATGASSKRTFQLRLGDFVFAGATGWICGMYYDNTNQVQQLFCASSQRAGSIDVALEPRKVEVIRRGKTLLTAHEK